jgi:hypothetical protein
MPFLICAQSNSLSLCKSSFLLPVLMAAVLSPATIRAQALQADLSPTQAQQDQPFHLRERRETLLEPDTTRRFRGRRLKVDAHKARPENAPPQCTSPEVSYVGGPVISNIQIVVVYWNSNVDATAQANLRRSIKV